MVPTLVSLLAASSIAEAGYLDVVYQDRIRGGVSADTSGVHVPSDATGNQDYYGPDLVVEIPRTASVEHVYALLTTRGKGLLPTNDQGVRINGVPLTAAISLGAVDPVDTRVVAYELPQNRFRIDRAGTYTYSESSKVENPKNPGFGVFGTTLVVVYSDDSHYGRRHVSVLGTTWTLGQQALPGLPTEQVLDDAVMSISLALEPWHDQGNQLYVDGNLVTTQAGGADDGDYPVGYLPKHPLQGANSLITGGSFGVDDTDTVVGTDGDDPDLEPLGGTINDSRLSDELYRVPHDFTGTMDVDLRPVGMLDDQWISAVILSVEVDTDEDGIEDARDEDIDGDGLTNDVEERRDTDVYLWDTDGDGASDGVEVANGTNPLRP